MKPNCYDCKFVGDVAGSAHSRCNHPSTLEGNSPGAEIMAIFASVGRAALSVNQAAADKLHIEANYHGICKGWFNWPYNFDPVWLERCEGFTAKDKKVSDERP